MDKTNSCLTCQHFEKINITSEEKPPDGFGTMGRCNHPDVDERGRKIYTSIWFCDFVSKDSDMEEQMKSHRCCEIWANKKTGRMIEVYEKFGDVVRIQTSYKNDVALQGHAQLSLEYFEENYKFIGTMEKSNV